jgi:hypothetical protein
MKLSPAQSRAMVAARETGALYRCPEQGWSCRDDLRFGPLSASTVHSLVDRGLLRFTEWRYNAPIKAVPTKETKP